MKYSLVNGIKAEPFQNGKGICECCGTETLAKCGAIKMHHWAHSTKKDCDKWWESEGLWHREWKDKFPREWQEIVHRDKDTNEIHRADVKTEYGLIIELQSSPISIDELTSRETFYKNMIWIVNGSTFRDNFHILDKLPNLDSSKFDDYVFSSAKKKWMGRSYFLLSENPDFPDNSMVRIHSLHKISKEIDTSYKGHHLFDWVKPHQSWLMSEMPVFIDLGDDNLYKIMRRKAYERSSIRIYSKKSLIDRIIKKQSHASN